MKQAAKYKKKPSPDKKTLIRLQLFLEIKTLSELSKEYDLPRSTIQTYSRAKGLMYQPLEDSILKNIRKWLVMSFQRLNNYKCVSLVRKDIQFYIETEEFLQYSDNNPFLRLIPKSKQNSKRERLFKRILKYSLAYYKGLKTNWPTDSQQEQIDQLNMREREELQVNQELYDQKNEFQEYQNYFQTDSVNEIFRDQDSYQFDY